MVEIRKQASLNLSNVRHSFLILSDEVHDEADEVASILHKAHKLRTFLLHSSITRVPYNFFHHLRCLRALDLSQTRLNKLPQSVEQLKHLRYLDLSYTHIEELPELVSNCRNLQTLRLNACARLYKLPRGMRKMIFMRHLELEDTHMLKFLRQGVGRLTELRTLTDFIVGGGDEGCKCGELKNLNHLQGRLRIIGLENVRSTDEAREAELYKKQHVHALILDYDSIGGGLLDEEVKRRENVLEILQPNTNLKEFEIWNYEGSKLPSWIEDPVFSNLVKVNLMNCSKCKKLPGLGKLPSLKCLIIEGMEEEEWELRGGDGEVMPSLLQLEIRDCPKLKALPYNLPPLLRKLALNITNDGMSLEGPLPVLPNLNHLVIWYSPELTSFPCGWLGQLKALQTREIYRCPMLGSLPEELPHLTMLRELKITCCPLLVDRCRDGGEDWDNIAHIPCIKIFT
ncbi:disease resistance protein RGA2-like [Magnolia sinica]|uniref:disease resistance protein RGA2-like n=1 Tax=Magnolia sinica TaxID=86752 RepID=UPI002659419F|nr:disease resistance protein RGA2-like [Magnolia sinica]